jgi:hypothetical protein
MATISILQPISEDAELRKKEAKEHWKAIQQSGPLVSTNSLRIGFHAAALKRNNLFGLLGYASEKDAQEASGIKQATWYNVMRIAEAFPNVEEKLFIAMKLTNAEAAMDLPESKRFTEYWLRRAATDPIDLFQAAVDTELDGKAKESDGKERVVSYSVRMPKSRKTAVDAGLKEYAKEVGCEGDDSKALELMVAEHTGGGVSLVGSVHFALRKIAEIKKLNKTNMSASEMLEMSYEMLDEVVEHFRKALEGFQNLESSGK